MIRGLLPTSEAWESGFCEAASALHMAADYEYLKTEFFVEKSMNDFFAKLIDILIE